MIGPEGTPLEIQVRTREMHEEAEYGIAAHWLYKRGKGKQDDEWLTWVKSLMVAGPCLDSGAPAVEKAVCRRATHHR